MLVSDPPGLLALMWAAAVSLGQSEKPRTSGARALCSEREMSPAQKLHSKWEMAKLYSRMQILQMGKKPKSLPRLRHDQIKPPKEQIFFLNGDCSSSTFLDVSFFPTAFHCRNNKE